MGVTSDNSQFTSRVAQNKYTALWKVSDKHYNNKSSCNYLQVHCTNFLQTHHKSAIDYYDSHVLTSCLSVNCHSWFDEH